MDLELDRNRRYTRRTTRSKLTLSPVNSVDDGNAWSLRMDGVVNGMIDLNRPDLTWNHYQTIPRYMVTQCLSTRSPRVVHVGGGLLGAVRALGDDLPDSVHVVFEADDELYAFVTGYLPLPESTRLRVTPRIGMGEELIKEVPPESADAVLTDVYYDSNVPEVFTSPEYLESVAKALTSTGITTTHIVDTNDLERSHKCLEDARSILGNAYLIVPRRLEVPRTELFVVAAKEPISQESIDDVLHGTRFRVQD